jgi:hypothetical protein
MGSGKTMKSKLLILAAGTILMLASLLAHAGETITVAPASLSLKGNAGKMHTQNFRLSNLTERPYTFKVDVADVVVENGQRHFVPAGQTANGIATLVTPKHSELRLSPGQEATVPVTFVMPSESRIRAVAIFFHGVPETVAPNQRRILLNLGAVVDFSMSNEVLLDSLSLDITPQTATTNTVIRQQLANIGPEPTIVRGVAAFLDQSGKLVGKAALSQKRLLPGERNAVTAEFAGTLPSGRYRVVSSLEYSGETMTQIAELIIP